MDVPTRRFIISSLNDNNRTVVGIDYILFDEVSALVFVLRRPEPTPSNGFYGIVETVILIFVSILKAKTYGFFETRFSFLTD